MTSLTKNKPRAIQTDNSNGLPMAAGAQVYEGSAVGRAAGAEGVRALVSGDVFVGFAATRCDNRAGALGAQTARLVSRGEVELVVAGAVASSLGASVYATDDDAYTLTPGGSAVGTVKRVPAAGRAIVAFDALLPALTSTQVSAVGAGVADVLAISDAFCRWCIPGKDTSGTVFKDVSGRGNDGTIEASNTSPFAIDNRMATAAHVSAGGIVVPLAATLCDFTSDSFIMAFMMTNEDPASSESVASWGAGAGGASYPGFYISHRSSAAGVGRIVGNRGNGALVSGSDSTVKFSNAGGTRETHVGIAYDGQTRSAYLYRDGVLAASNVGLMSASNDFTVVAPLYGARLGGTSATGATVVGIFRGWQGYVFEGSGLPLNVGRIMAILAESPSVPLANRDFTFAT